MTPGSFLGEPGVKGCELGRDRRRLSRRQESSAEEVVFCSRVGLLPAGNYLEPGEGFTRYFAMFLLSAYAA